MAALPSYTCSQCSLQAEAQELPGKQGFGLPEKWSSLVLGGMPEMHLLLCQACRGALVTFLDSWRSKIIELDAITGMRPKTG